MIVFYEGATAAGINLNDEKSGMLCGNHIYIVRLRMRIESICRCIPHIIEACGAVDSRKREARINEHRREMANGQYNGDSSLRSGVWRGVWCGVWPYLVNCPP